MDFRMDDMTPINLFESQAVIKVIGVGGGGCNAVNRMVEAGVSGVEFVALNTDKQALEQSLADTKLCIGEISTRGLGTGGDPSRGAEAARESERAILDILDGCDMVFITAGMGGGTGTGAAPVVAELARRLDILSIGVITKPFMFEGPKRKNLAVTGASNLKAQVDTLIIVPNDKILEVVDKGAPMSAAFRAADDILRQGVQGISDIITKPGLINVDFADVKSVMKDAGIALMGMGRGIGDSRARNAAEAAANSPLLETKVQGAKKILVNITGGPSFSIGEVREAMEYVNQLADSEEAEIFMGHVTDPNLSDEVYITLLAAGMEQTTRRAPEQTVFEQAPPIPRTVVEQPQELVAPRANAKPIELAEIDLDIPSFLRRQKK
ncbi:MAG: cell division protein FtsZ [Fimbriimonadaceae bacterium]|nr:cell division protein FtsZ [Fimbriimonadaceae bacterium]